MLNMLEKLLSMTEPLLDRLDPVDRDDWYKISARTADLREHLGVEDMPTDDAEENMCSWVKDVSRRGVSDDEILAQVRAALNEV
ncbi:MAG: hypothetical protein DWQ19_12920 [Crenarchaeota archaeon]|nr:MAG: hypothetical protein DWQ19_12920 [Thermoproteota archaeon]